MECQYKEECHGYATRLLEAPKYLFSKYQAVSGWLSSYRRNIRVKIVLCKMRVVTYLFSVDHYFDKILGSFYANVPVTLEYVILLLPNFARFRLILVVIAQINLKVLCGFDNSKVFNFFRDVNDKEILCLGLLLFRCFLLIVFSDLVYLFVRK